MKKCRHCNEYKEHLYVECKFNSKDGIREYFCCRECGSKRAREYRKTKGGKLVWANIQRRQYKKFSKKVIARTMLYAAVKSGKVLKPNRCSKCKSNRNIQGHHTDYLKPLEVIWLCKICHDMV